MSAAGILAALALAAVLIGAAALEGTSPIWVPTALLAAAAGLGWVAHRLDRPTR